MEQVVRKSRPVAHQDEALDIAKAALSVAQATSDKVDRVISMLGTETEDGRGGYAATGLLGRVRRVESTALGLVRKYQGWFQVFAGFGGAITFVAALVTFLVSNHIVKIG